MKQILILIFSLGLAISVKATPNHGGLQCLAQTGNQIALTWDGNPRNGAHAQVSALRGDLDFGGTWLWLLHVEESSLFSKWIFRTMNRSQLILTRFMGPANCGRGSCDPSHLSRPQFQLKWIKNDGHEINFHCQS